MRTEGDAGLQHRSTYAFVGSNRYHIWEKRFTHMLAFWKPSVTPRAFKSPSHFSELQPTEISKSTDDSGARNTIDHRITKKAKTKKIFNSVLFPLR